jgi:hypothetical protein
MTLGMCISEGESSYQVLRFELIHSFCDSDSPPDLSSLGSVGREKETEALFAHLLYCILDDSFRTLWLNCC